MDNTCDLIILLLLWASVNRFTDAAQRQYYGPHQKQKSSSSWDHGTCSSFLSDPAAQIIKNIYSSVVKADCDLANLYSYPPHYSPVDWEEFDFIIVGAGSAGAVVANRLTEISGWKVLLLEAGANPTKTSEVPALFSQLQKSDVDWQYQTEPNQNYCLGMEGNRCNWPRGKILGGSSTLNFMLYVRGNAKDFDGWEKEGNTGWGYEDVLPYFKKSEDMRAEEVLNTPEFSKYHSTGGYLKIETWQNEKVKPLANAFAEGMQELGYYPNPDGNGKNQTGFIRLQGTLKDGRRCSTAKAFLSPITHRRNLKVSKRSLVTKVLINEKLRTAYGVEFLNKDGTITRVRAKKEVILSAGAINTPQILMLSGIGPRKHLHNLKIKVIKDLPVGENLQDHLLTIGNVISLNYSKTSESLEESMFNFLMKRNNRLSGLGMTSYAGFLNTVKGVDYPDIELMPMDFDKNDSAGLSEMLRILGVREEIRKTFLELNSNSYTVIMLGSLLRPYSRGRIQLKSSNPKESPKITAGYFSDQRDLEKFSRFYDFLSELVETDGLKRIGAKLYQIEVEACSGFKDDSRKYRECSLRYLTTTSYHQCCSTKMGPANSADSVVDSHLCVKGIKGLRVIDASIMSNEVSGNINAAVIMIGEKGSDLLKETWLHKNQRPSNSGKT